jgi:hypothetical protein
MSSQTIEALKFFNEGSEAASQLNIGTWASKTLAPFFAQSTCFRAIYLPF